MSNTNIDNNSLAHTKWNCKYHIVFAPKYCRKVFFEEKRLEIREILRQLCQWKGVEIIEGEVCIDHIHLLVSIPPKTSVSGFMYTWYNDEFIISASFDAVSGALVTFNVYHYYEQPPTEEFDHEQNWQMAYEWIKTLVSDPEAYERGLYTVSPGSYVEYQFTRCVGDLRTNDAIYVTFDVPTGQMYSISLGYIGAMRGMEPLPESVIQSLEQMLESFMLHPDDKYTINDELFLMPDGRLAMECRLDVHYTELTDGRETLRKEQAWLLVYLTEPIQ